MFPDLPSGRRLTAAERLQLAELERRLQEEDPALVRTFSAGPSAPATSPLPRVALVAFAVVAVALLVAAAVVGGAGGAAAVAASLVGTAGVLITRRRLQDRRDPRTAEPADRVAG